MTEQRYDKLGRRIPEFDRSAASKKGAKTKEEKYGPDYHSRVAANAGSRRTRGYFGKLKDEGKIEELKELSQKGIQANKSKQEKD